MIKIENFLYEEGENLIFCHVTYKLVYNLLKTFRVFQQFKNILSFEIVTFCKSYSSTYTFFYDVAIPIFHRR